MALENARLYDEIRHQALHDGLTGLANRVLFRDRVVQALERRHGREGRPFAVLFIDLDDFKVLNDTLGHARGDDVLIAAAARVEASLRPSDTAARLGGDEFAVLLDDVGDEATALSIAIRLADTLRQPVNLGDATPTIAASIGVALSGTDGETADDLLRNADVAMYAAKTSSRGRAEVFRSAQRGGGRRPARPRRPAPRRRSPRRAPPRLPADRRARQRRGRRARGARPLAAAGPAAADAGPVHRRRRGDRRHRPDGPVDPARVVPPDPRVAAPPRAAVAPGQRQPLVPPVPGAGPRRVDPAGHRGHRACRRRA